ncbi:MAG: discoidin domain-containing protein [Planctomycetes bacterium]|nr:discoidin domain-containing protein [Planctomycetota bacterium]
MSQKLLFLTSLLLVLGLVGADVAIAGETFEVRVADTQNDNEEDLNPSKLGETDLDSSDLEFPYEDEGQVDPQLVGVRFQQVTIPAGKFVWSAWIRFEVDELKSPENTLPVNVIIEGELSPDAAEFAPEGAGTFDISSRPVTTAKAYWSVPTWETGGDQGDAQTSVNIAPVIQEIIDQPGWASGNSIVLIIRDDPNNPSEGMRAAEHAPGDDACLLHVEYEDYPLNPEAAYNPSPSHEETDALRDGGLTWIPITPQNTAYLGTDFDAVNAATEADHPGVTVFAGLDNTLDPGRLELGQTYYWRVDGDSRGNIWNFTVESVSYLVPAADVNAVASSEVSSDQTALNTINGSGFSDGLHNTDDTQMWLSADTGEASTYIQYEFRRPQLLQKMMIWNYNAMSETFVGWGVKDVAVETSLDGENWSAVEGVTSFAQSLGLPDTEATDVFEFATPIPAQFLRITTLSNYGGIVKQYGLSEVQFYAVPAYAADLEPADGASIDLGNAPMLSWRPGRNVDQHSVLLSTDANNLAEVASISDVQIAAASLDLLVGQTYYWQINEVNENDSPSVYTGDSQSFFTLPYIMVDDFEQYNNVSPTRPFQTWTDGFGYSADEHFPAGYGGNGTGSGVGHDIWSLASPHYDGSIMETSIVIPGSTRSMPLYFAGNSETTRTFASPQDWTQAGVTTLTMWFYGDAGNTASQMYVKINSTKVPYSGNASDLQLAGWQVWNIDLTSLSGMQSVTSMTVGVEGGSASGVLLLDDFRLVPTATAALTEWRISASTDDAEQFVQDGVMDSLTSSDLELGYEGSEGIVPEFEEIVGCRWTGIAIPKGATITEAWVQFSADAVDSAYHIGDVSLIVSGELPVNPVAFTDALNDISNRPTTTASAVWDVPEWLTTHAMGPEERTPDISSVIQEIVNHDGWTGTVVLMFADNPAKPSQACREAESFDGTTNEAPLLHIAYE